MLSIGTGLPAGGTRLGLVISDRFDEKAWKRRRCQQQKYLGLSEGKKRSAAMVEPVMKAGALAMPAPLMLTSGASGRVSALLSLSALRSFLLLVVRGLFLVLVAPFQSLASARFVSRAGPTPAGGSSEKAWGDEKQPEGSRAGKKGSAGPVVVRVPAAMVPRRAVVPLEAAARRALAIKRVAAEEEAGGDQGRSKKDFALFVTARGDTLFTRSWSPVTASPKGLVVLLHGLNEHSGRYDSFAKKLNDKGFKVYGMDWIGAAISVGNGERTSFWRDRWCGGSTLCVAYPDLYQIASAPTCTVAQALGPSPLGRVWAPTFRRHLRELEIEQLESMLAQLHIVETTDRVDLWKWRWEKDGKFSVKSAYNVISDGGLRHGLHKIVWKTRSPTKTKILIWRISHGRLPTRVTLARFLPEIDPTCVLCGMEEETIEHIFLKCSYSRIIWMKIEAITLCDIPQEEDLSRFMAKWRRTWQLKGDDRIWWLILHATLWMIWGERNKRIFDRVAKDAEQLFVGISRVVKEWAFKLCQVDSSSSSLLSLLGG